MTATGAAVAPLLAATHTSGVDALVFLAASMIVLAGAVGVVT